MSAAANYSITKKMNTFRLLQREVARQSTSSQVFWQRVLNPSTLILLVIGVFAALGSYVMAKATDTVGYGMVISIIQTIGIVLFMVDEKYDWLTTRIILGSYIVYYAIMHFGGTVYLPPIYWGFTHILFSFIVGGAREGLAWIGLHAAILFGGLWYWYSNDVTIFTTEQTTLLLCAYVVMVGFAFLLDYTSRMLAKQFINQNRVLEDANARYAVMLNGVADGLIAVDRRGVVEFVNEQAYKLLSIEPEFILQHSLTKAIKAQDANGVEIPAKDRALTKALKSGESLALSLLTKEHERMVRPDGTSFPVAMSIRPVKVGQRIRGAIVLFRDITQEEEMDRAKSEFVSLASHQLRTPLNVVSWYAEKLRTQKKGKLNATQLDYLEEIESNNKRMIGLVADLLNISRIELGRIKIKHEPVALIALVKQLVTEARPLMEQKRIAYLSNLPSEEVNLENSDQGVMTVIVQNLITNAIKYTPEKGAIALDIRPVTQGSVINDILGTTATEPGVLISVIDTGIGIPTSQQDKIFGKLFRADNAQAYDVGGTGLGLYVTRSFIEAFGGAIWFQSTEGKGTTFFVFLPIKSHAPGEPEFKPGKPNLQPIRSKTPGAIT